MNALVGLVREGGVVIVAIMVLSVILYSRCFKLLLSLRLARKQLEEFNAVDERALPALTRARQQIQESFRGQRVALGAMIAAAPLLGLIGTVSGMEKTFASLGARAGEKSMEGLARGISEVLVATESGLTVAIPALLMIYLAHREVHHHVTRLNEIARGLGARKEIP